MVGLATLHRSEEYVGAFIEQMPLLRAAGRIPMSVAGSLQWRLDVANRPKRDTIRASRVIGHVNTGDAVYRHSNGDAKLVLDDQPLWHITEDTRLVQGAVPKTEEQWEQLMGGNVLFVPAKRVKKLRGIQYTQKSVTDSPEWNFLARSHERLAAYADTFFPEMKSRLGYDRAMGFYFPTMQEMPIQRALSVNGLSGRSNVDGSGNLCLGGRLVGVPPEAQGRC